MSIIKRIARKIFPDRAGLQLDVIEGLYGAIAQEDALRLESYLDNLHDIETGENSADRHLMSLLLRNSALLCQNGKFVWLESQWKFYSDEILSRFFCPRAGGDIFVATIRRLSDHKTLTTLLQCADHIKMGGNRRQLMNRSTAKIYYNDVGLFQRSYAEALGDHSLPIDLREGYSQFMARAKDSLIHIRASIAKDIPELKESLPIPLDALRLLHANYHQYPRASRILTDYWDSYPEAVSPYPESPMSFHHLFWYTLADSFERQKHKYSFREFVTCRKIIGVDLTWIRKVRLEDLSILTLAFEAHKLSQLDISISIWEACLTDYTIETFIISAFEEWDKVHEESEQKICRLYREAMKLPLERLFSLSETFDELAERMEINYHLIGDSLDLALVQPTFRLRSITEDELPLVRLLAKRKEYSSLRKDADLEVATVKYFLGKLS